MILVTGGTGFVGRALVQSLQHRNEPVSLLTRARQAGGLPADVGLRQGDLTDPTALKQALQGVRTIVHLAGALAGSETVLERINVTGSVNLARAAVAAGVTRFIHISSAGVYGDHSGAGLIAENAELRAASPYERSKLRGEQGVIAQLRGSGTDWVVLRPGGVYGGGRPSTQAFIRTVRERPFWVHLPPRIWLHPTHITDVVHAIEAAIDLQRGDGQVFNVGGEKAFAFDQWVDQVGHALGIRVRRVRVPAGGVVWCARGVGTTLRVLRLPIPERLARAQSAELSRSLDISQARARLGFRPTPLAEALAETLAGAAPG
jgi:nucleoside-diphosphate-sugar epimerase